MKAISKNKKFGPYQAITTEQRKRVIDLVFTFNLPVKEAAKFVGIHPQTAKNFLAIYVKEGRIGKKQKREKHSHGLAFNSKCIELNQKKVEEEKEEEIPDWLPYKNQGQLFNKMIEIPVIRLTDQEKTMPTTTSLGKPNFPQDNYLNQRVLKDLSVVAWANQISKTQEALKSIQLFNLLSSVEAKTNNSIYN